MVIGNNASKRTFACRSEFIVEGQKRKGVRVLKKKAARVSFTPETPFFFDEVSPIFGPK